MPGGKTGEYVQSQPGVSPLPPGYDDVVVSAPSAQITGDGDANEKVLVGSGNLSGPSANDFGHWVTLAPSRA